MKWTLRVGAFVLLSTLAGGVLADEKIAAEKAAGEWLYPRAKVGPILSAGDVSCVIQETADDVGTVLKHYGDKLGIELSEQGAVSGSKGSLSCVLVGSNPTGAGVVATFKKETVCATLVI